MFEAAQEQQAIRFKSDVSGNFVVIAALVVGGVLYTMSKAAVIRCSGYGCGSCAFGGRQSGRGARPEDPKRKNGKGSSWNDGDLAGGCEQQSKAYTYSSIQYETTYVGPDMPLCW